MREKQRVFMFMLVLAIACVSVSFTAIYILYRASVNQQEEWLLQVVENRAITIKTIYEHSQEEWGEAEIDSSFETSFDYTIEQLRVAHERFKGFGETGEFTLAKRDGDWIVFLLSHRHGGPVDTGKILFASKDAEPMRRALSGKSGVMENLLDYRGEKVLAAYRPIKEMQLGLVVKKDMSEIRAPFVKAGLIVTAISALIIVFGGLAIKNISAPLIKKLEDYSLELESRIEEGNKVHEALKESEEWLFTVLSSIGDAVIATDVNSRVKFINKVSERMTGWKSEEAVGRHIDEVFKIINEHSREAAPTPIKKVLAEGKVMGLANHTLLVSRDGSEYPISDSAAPIRDLSGKVTGVVLVFQDDTEKKKVQYQMVQMQKMESLGTLAGGIAHDFNNMLAVIMGSANLLMIDMDENDPNYTDVYSIMDASRRAKELTMKLLTFSRKDRVEVRNVRVSEIIENIRVMLSRTLEKNIRVEQLVKDDCVIQADVNQIHQALLNICNNAADSMPDGGVLSIECMTVASDNSICGTCGKNYDGDYCVILVSDEGIGIPREMLSRVVEPFFTTKGVGKGTGLGLSVAHGIISEHKGHMHIYSEPGKGTCVKLYIPLSDEKRAVSEREEGKDNYSGSETVLVIDDEPSILMMTERILKAMGYKPIIASGGPEGIEKYKEKQFEIDVVILDLMMPVMDGAQVFNVLKGLDPDVKVILSSGYSVTGKAASLLQRGANKFVQKPFTVETICKSIREVMENPRTEA